MTDRSKTVKKDCNTYFGDSFHFALVDVRSRKDCALAIRVYHVGNYLGRNPTCCLGEADVDLCDYLSPDWSKRNNIQVPLSSPRQPLQNQRYREELALRRNDGVDHHGIVYLNVLFEVRLTDLQYVIMVL